MVEAGLPDVGATDPAGKLVNVGETYTDNWDPTNAQNEMAAAPDQEQQQDRHRLR
jgi:ABC-type xylose transport system substrate-binding protein